MINKDSISINETDFTELFNEIYKLNHKNESRNDNFVNLFETYNKDIKNLKNFILKNTNGNINIIKQNPEKIFDFLVNFKIEVLNKEIDDFSNSNRFLNVSNKYLESLKNIPNENDSRTLTKNILTNLIVEQKLKTIDIYNKYRSSINEVYDLNILKLSLLNKNNFNLTEKKKISEFKVKILSEDPKFIKFAKNIILHGKIFIYNKLKLPYNELLVEFNNLKNIKNTINEKKAQIITIEDKQKTIEKVRDNNINTFRIDLSENLNKESLKKQILLDDNFVNNCDLFDKQKIKLHELNYYSKELSEFFNNAIGNKVDLIMKNISTHLENFKIEIEKEGTLLTKVSKSLTSFDSSLRISSIEGKTITQFSKDFLINTGIKFTAKKIIVLGTVCILGACNLNIQLSDFKNNKIDTKTRIEFTNLLKSKNLIKDSEIENHDFKSILNNINSLSENDCSTLIETFLKKDNFLDKEVINNKINISKNINLDI